MSRDGSAGQRRWLADLPAVVADLADRWSLDLGRPFRPGGSMAWVAPARRRAAADTGHPADDLVLKVGWRHDEAEHEAEGLRLWDGRGAVRLFEAERSATTSALLIEGCVPGRTLGATSPGPEQGPDRDAVVAQVLLCTDLHAGNILAAHRQPWLAIDPKPWVGHPAYDVLQHLMNEQDRLLADPQGLISRTASLLDLSRERLRRWVFARCVVESGNWPRLAQVAQALT
jgi:streptomycin 6-kinase